MQGEVDSRALTPDQYDDLVKVVYFWIQGVVYTVVCSIGEFRLLWFPICAYTLRVNYDTVRTHTKYLFMCNKVIIHGDSCNSCIHISM